MTAKPISLTRYRSDDLRRRKSCLASASRLLHHLYVDDTQRMSEAIPAIRRARDLALSILPEGTSEREVKYATMQIAILYQEIDDLRQWKEQWHGREKRIDVA